MQLIEEKNYLENLKHNSQIYPDDYWKMEELCKGHLRERVEIRYFRKLPDYLQLFLIKKIFWFGPGGDEFVFFLKDVSHPTLVKKTARLVEAVRELTKIISAHLAKNQVLNMIHEGVKVSPEYDSLTGLLSFTQFKEETELIIVGDQLLKEYSNYLMGFLENEQEVYFSRVVADQFVLFMPCRDMNGLRGEFEEMLYKKRR